MEGLELIRDLGLVVLAAAISGWLCRRVGLSVVVGYLVAGILAGPHVPWPALVGDAERITTLSQIGLVFLMFSMGLQLSVRRLRSLGTSVAVAVLVCALAVLLASRMLGAVLGMSTAQGLFFAAVLMVSSSAIIGKSLIEAKRSHERSGQTVLAMTLLEDVVAAGMLALLTSYVVIGGGDVGVGRSVGLLAAFVTLLLVGGLLVVPWLLRRFSGGAMKELQTLLVAGLLFTLAYFAQHAGYSMALGSFILGAIVAETRQRGQIERTFSGLKDLFSAVFFVAIGMMIDVSAYATLWWQVLLLAGFVMVLRAVAAASGALVAGRPLAEAVEAGVSLTPLGEFSFVIAQIAIAAGVFGNEFQLLVVGAAILTALAAPLLTRHAPFLGEVCVRRSSQRFRQVLEGYRRFLDRSAEQRAGSVVWQLSRKRIGQIGIGILFVTGWLVFMPMIEGPFAVWTGASGQSFWFRSVFWCSVVLFAMIPMLAVWRNISAISMLYAEVASAGFPNRPAIRGLADNGIKVVCAAGLVLWFESLLPFEPSQKWFVAAVAALSVALLWLFWREMVRWHSEMEVRLGETLEQEAAGRPTPMVTLGSSARNWDWIVEECPIPENAVVAGTTVAALSLRTRFSCMVVGIDRQGFVINNPSGAERLFPLDVVLVAGTRASIRSARAELEAEGSEGRGGVSDFVVERIVVPEGCPRAGIPLGDSRPGLMTGAQIAGIRRGSADVLSPDGKEHLRVGDELLVIGDRSQLERFRVWLSGAC